eukprot:NODE_1109_length_2177_cov_1.523099.p1 type:complete len:419 gc:universal NODE_1109_length_2177_cov_1.523099:1675-419(-)
MKMPFILLLLSQSTNVDLGKTQSIDLNANSQLYFEFNIPASLQKQSLFSSSIPYTYDNVDPPSLVFSLLLCSGSMPNAYLSTNPQPGENQFDIQVRETGKGVRQITLLSVSSSVLYVSIVSTGAGKAILQLGNTLQNTNGSLFDWSDANQTTSLFRQSSVPFGKSRIDLNQYNVSFFVTQSVSDPMLSWCFIESNYQKMDVSIYSATTEKYVVVDGLTKNNQYLGFILINRNGVRDVFSPIAFYTLNDESCSLVYGGSYKLNVCGNLARNIPNANNVPTQDLLSQWESFSAEYIKNFTDILGAFDCQNQKYSMVKTCKDCSVAYIDWVCRQIIPRCVKSDVPIPPKAYRPTRWISNDETKFEQNQDAFKITPDDAKFNQLQLKPYRRGLDCISFCLTTVQSCPTFFILQADCFRDVGH